jgi:hypothetical protein
MDELLDALTDLIERLDKMFEVLTRLTEAVEKEVNREEWQED